MERNMKLSDEVLKALQDEFKYSPFSLDQMLDRKLRETYKLCLTCGKKLAEKESVWCSSCWNTKTCKLCERQVHEVDQHSLCDQCTGRKPIRTGVVRVLCGDCGKPSEVDTLYETKIFRKGTGSHDSWAEYVGLIYRYSKACSCGAVVGIEEKVCVTIRDGRDLLIYTHWLPDDKWKGENCSVLECLKQRDRGPILEKYRDRFINLELPGGYKEKTFQWPSLSVTNSEYKEYPLGGG